MIPAAGLMLQAPDGRVLFIQRSASGDHAGEWAFPGGKMEAGESALDAAERETLEEIGPTSHEGATLFARQHMPVGPDGEQVDYSTFRAKVGEAFLPALNDESTAFAWADPATPPLPLHPGAAIALAKLTMDETQVAEAIAAGYLTSPQKLDNMWLFALRITGTGVSTRKSLDEIVWREPELYLNDHFLRRCNGLPVILDHPEGALLNGKEYTERSVGSICFPYIQGNEVWGIARIYDPGIAELMQAEKLSTSPCVFFGDLDVNETLTLEDGRKLLIEGKPTLLDHVAVCERGVWDKGGDPSGVQSTIVEKVMSVVRADSESEDEKKAREDAAARRDSRMDAFLSAADSVLARVDSVTSRMDAWEEKFKKDAEEEEKKKSDSAKKDSGDGDEEEKKLKEREAADKAKKDAEDEVKAKKDAEDEEKSKKDALDRESGLLARIAALEASTKPVSDTDRAVMADAQARCDKVAQMFGESAPRPLDGENTMAYRRRLVEKYKGHSPDVKALDLSLVMDDAHMAMIEKQVFADAATAANHPLDLPEHELREVITMDSTGRRIRTFKGHPRAWMAQFRQTPRAVSKFNKEA